MIRNIKNLNKLILDTQVQMVQKHGTIKVSRKIIVFGNTGSGKTTLCCLMSGKNVTIHVEDEIATLEYEGIGAGVESVTEIPTIMHDNTNNLAYIDTPGYRDTKGPLQEIKNTFATHYLLNANNKEIDAKILFVIKVGETDSSRSQDVKNLFERFDEMFPNLTDIEKSAIGIVFTCENSGKKPVFYINKLNRKASGSTKQWCEYFKNHQNQLFIMKEASEEMDGQQFSFDDKEELMKFIKKASLIKHAPYLSLGDDSKNHLEKGFLIHINDLLKEAENIHQTITDRYKQISDIEELNKWYINLRNISRIKITNPGVLKTAIENNLVNEKDIFKGSFEVLENLNALHSFFVSVLEIDDQEIIEKIQIPIESKTKKLISEFDTYLNLLKEKELKSEAEERERKSKIEAEEKERALRKEAEEKERALRKEAEEKERALKKEADERERISKMQAEEKERALRKEAEEKEQKLRKETEERERKSKIEAEEKERALRKELEEREQKLIKEAMRKSHLSKFEQENDIKLKKLFDSVEAKLEKGKTFYVNDDEKKGICHFLTIKKIVIESNSVQSNSDPDNVILPGKCFYSENIQNSYICFNFIRRKVKLDCVLICNESNKKYSLDNYRIEGSNDNYNWTTLANASGTDTTIFNWWTRIEHPQKDEDELYYKYIRIMQTGYSRNTNSYEMRIENIELFGSISEPIDLNIYG